MIFYQFKRSEFSHFFVTVHYQTKGHIQDLAKIQVIDMMPTIIPLCKNGDWIVILDDGTIKIFEK